VRDLKRKFLSISIFIIIIIFSGCGKKVSPPLPNYPPQIENFYISTDRVRISEVDTKVVLKVSASDKNLDPITYSWTASAGMLTSPTSSETEWYAPAESNIGDEFTITLWVMDLNPDGSLKGGKVSVSKTVKIVEDNYNRDPIIKSLTSSKEMINSVALKRLGDLFHMENTAYRQSVNIEAVVYDPDGVADDSEENPLQYKWRATGGIIADPESQDNPPPEPQGSKAIWYPYEYRSNKYFPISSGEYTITLEVTDKKGGTATKSLTLSVMWGSIKDMNIARWGFGTAVVEDKIYAIGGQNDMFNYQGLDTVEEYNPSENTWTTKQPLSSPRSYFATAVVNDKIYIIGGYSNGKKTDEVLEYDPKTGTSTLKSKMPGGPRAGCGCGVVGNIIYVVGGFEENGTPSNRVEAYDPESDTWSKQPNMPTARGNLAVVSWNNKIYAIGGFISANGLLSTSKLEVYNPYTKSWSSLPDMPTPRGELAASALNNKIYAIGGINSLSRKKIVEEFNILLGSWRSSETDPTLLPMSIARNAFSASVVNGTIYVSGGCDENNKPLKNGEAAKF
jgi:hypothetical protein